MMEQPHFVVPRSQRRQERADRCFKRTTIVWWAISLAIGLALFIGLALYATGAQAQVQPQAATTVEVFANSAMHITPNEDGRGQLPFKVNVYRVDAMHNVEQTLNQQLPQTEEEATAWMQAHQEQIRQQYEPAIKNTAQGMTLAYYYKLQQLPAVVVNRRTVVYGITDIEQAVAMAQAHEDEGEPQ